MSELFDNILVELLTREELPPLVPKSPYDPDITRQIDIFQSFSRQSLPGYGIPGTNIWTGVGDDKELRNQIGMYIKKMALLYLLNDEPGKAAGMLTDLRFGGGKDEIALWLEIMVAKRIGLAFTVWDIVRNISFSSSSPLFPILAHSYRNNPMEVLKAAERCEHPSSRAQREELQRINKEELLMTVHLILGGLPDIRADHQGTGGSEGEGSAVMSRTSSSSRSGMEEEEEELARSEGEVFLDWDEGDDTDEDDSEFVPPPPTPYVAKLRNRSRT